MKSYVMKLGAVLFAYAQEFPYPSTKTVLFSIDSFCDCGSGEAVNKSIKLSSLGK